MHVLLIYYIHINVYIPVTKNVTSSAVPVS